MLVRDKNCIVLQMPLAEHSGGDSSRTTGMLALCGSGIDQMCLPLFEVPKNSGLLTRHPDYYDTQCFTRDQLLCFMAGVWRAQMRPLAKRIFWTHAKRLFFCQNQLEQFTRKDKGWFGRDPLGPQHIGMLILCARIYWLYPFLLIAFPVMLLDIIWATKVRPDMEQNQIIAMCFVYDLIWLYTFLHPTWAQEVRKYWSNWRQMPEVADLLIKTINRT